MTADHFSILSLVSISWAPELWAPAGAEVLFDADSNFHVLFARITGWLILAQQVPHAASYRAGFRRLTWHLTTMESLSQILYARVGAKNSFEAAFIESLRTS